MPITVKLPDGSRKEFPDGSTSYDVAKSIGKGLAKAAIAASVNGEVWDLHRKLPSEAELKIITEETPEGWDVLRHSASHIMAGAVKRLFPGARLGIGPAIEDGFYYDIDSSKTFSDDDLQKIEQEMAKIVKDDAKFERTEVPKGEAVKIMREMGEKYKLELLNEIPDATVSLYRDGDFLDLCTGPHIPSTGRLAAFKLLKATGAYWRGSEKNPMLQRIYGTAFHNKKALEDHLNKIEEAKKRDHRKLGKELDLFSVHEEVGGGLVHWHPKGAIIRNIIEDYWRKIHIKNNYQLVFTPHIASEEIYKISGHLQNYSDLMYSAMDIEDRPYRIKPMNCPGHIMIYNTRLHSYKELPIRFAELGTVYRFEKSGVLHGLMRVRGFTIDDSHIFCTAQQLESEVLSVFNFSLEFLKTFGFMDFDIYLATKPEKAVGSDENWAKATESLKQALDKTGIPYKIDEGGGAFYGPKIDLKVKDCLGRPWQCSTIQFDFNLPERFDINYIGDDSKKNRPYMVHRAIMGSVERFFGVLIEHYGGDFPLWLAPVQVAVLSVTETEEKYAREVYNRLVASGFRAEIDLSGNRISYKIREATNQKVPYMLIIGEREGKDGSVAVRERKKGDVGASRLENFISEIKVEIDKVKM